MLLRPARHLPPSRPGCFPSATRTVDPLFSASRVRVVKKQFPPRAAAGGSFAGPSAAKSRAGLLHCKISDRALFRVSGKEASGLSINKNADACPGAESGGNKENGGLRLRSFLSFVLLGKELQQIIQFSEDFHRVHPLYLPVNRSSAIGLIRS